MITSLCNITFWKKKPKILNFGFILKILNQTQIWIVWNLPLLSFVRCATSLGPNNLFWRNLHGVKFAPHVSVGTCFAQGINYPLSACVFQGGEQVVHGAMALLLRASSNVRIQTSKGMLGEVLQKMNSWFTLIWDKHSSKCETKWKFHESLTSPLNLNGELRDSLWQMTFEAPKKRFISTVLCGPFWQIVKSHRRRLIPMVN